MGIPWPKNALPRGIEGCERTGTATPCTVSDNRGGARRSSVEKEQTLCRYWLSLGLNGETKAKARSLMSCRCTQILLYVNGVEATQGIASSMRKANSPF